jgi:hypothetical protein|tara:strand:+ start:256 stop:606 length:351 start_codon:yes stop_codon:yes gene_type:complete
MCLGIGASATTIEKKPKFSNAPPVVTGKQTGVDNPKDTKKATESLMIKRQKEEGTYIDPSQQNLATVTKLTGGGGNKTAQQKANLAKNKAKAKSLASARMKSKFSRGLQGRKSRTA